MTFVKRPRHRQTTPHLPLKSRPLSHPCYGSAQEVESGEQDDDYFDEEEGDWELEEELAKLEEYFAEDEDDFGSMPDSWPSAVPNRLASKSNSNDVRESCLGLPLSLPYEVETLEEMDDRLDLILCKLVECVKAREYGMGFRMWDSALSIWMSMGYPMKKEVKIQLAFLYYELMFIPGRSSSFIEDAGNQFISLIGDHSLNIWDFRVPWRPLYDALYNELFPHPQKLARHAVNLAPLYLNVAEAAQRFFHPGDVDEMLEVILPRFDSSMDSILATQTFLVHFLPITHCQKWLPVVFRLWYGLNSGLWDDQASDLLGQLAIAHVVPGTSDPSLIDKIPRGQFNTPEEEARNPNHKRAERGHKERLLVVAGEVEEDEDGINTWADPTKMPPPVSMSDPNWQGIRKEVGIFTEQEFEFLMSKCLRSLNVPVGGSLANAMSVTTSDVAASRKILDAKKPIDRVQSLAETIIFCMSKDADAAPSSSSGTSTPMPQAVSRLQNGSSMKRGASSDSLAAAGAKGDEKKTYMAQCKALDHLSRLLTSCETFFHPSNSGHWSAFLTIFLTHLASNFVERWTTEQEPHCKTPVEWRLTPEIKRQFVLTLRPLALTALFNKDMTSVAPVVSALRTLSLLEPDLIMPALMERATSSLQGLEETARTPAVMYAIASLAQSLAARQIWRVGGMFVGDIFTLLLPGIDLNDPAKTGLTCMSISNMVDFMRISDISEVSGDGVTPGSRAMRKVSRPPVEDDPNDPAEPMEKLTPEEVDARVKMSTAVFRDWVPEFLGRVLLLFANLPEEGGKSGKAGGKTEALTVHSVLHTCGGVFAALDEKLFDTVLDQVYEYTTTTCRSNAVDSVGELVRNLASANAPKVFAKLFPVARQRILSELKAGASSTRTQTTSIPIASDAALHWWSSILLGMLIPGRVDISDEKYRSQYIDLLRTMISSTFSERGWVWTGKLIEKSVSCLCSTYLTEMRMVNPDVYKSDDFQQNHHLWWGKMYRPSEVQVGWRKASASDLDMAFEILTFADECTVKINSLLDNRSVGDQVWSNEFCRAVNVIDQTLRGSYNLFQEVQALKTGGKEYDSYLPPEIHQMPPPYKSGVLLTDPKDPRYQHVMDIRRRIGEALTRAATVMRDAGESDNSVENIKILVTTIGTLLTAYGIRSKQYSTAQTAYASLLANKKLYEGQRKHHRSIWMAAASIHHQNRLSTMAYYRYRSDLDDRLIVNLLDFCLSPFTRIRRSAQSTLDTVASLYRGTSVLCYPTLFDALQPGTDPDRMKGALYVLRYNHVGLSRLSRDWRQLPETAYHLLNAHHEQKASVQALVSKATDELLSRLKEPSSFFRDIQMEKTDGAVERLVSVIGAKPSRDVVGRLHQAIADRIKLQDEASSKFVDQLLVIAKNSTLNWRYVLAASRFLAIYTRKDRPTDLRLAKYFGDNVQNPHPRIRDFSMGIFSRMSFHIAFRSLCGSDEVKIFLQEPDDPLTEEIELTDTSSTFTSNYLASFREPLPQDVTSVQLYERPETGWLAWGKTIEVTRMTGWEEDVWQLDPESKEGIELLREMSSSEAWWQSIADHWAREDQRNYLAASHIDFVLGLTQLYGKPIFELVKPIVEAFLSEMDKTKVYDRHKTRAMWEFISGLIRGADDWPGKDRAVLWEWFTAKLPELFNNVRHDTIKCWDMGIENILNRKDPRRLQPLVDFLVNTALAADFSAGSAFDLARRVQIIRSLIRCFQWRFNAWADDTAELYFRNIDCAYAEVRSLMASVLNALDQIKFHPSYPSASALTRDVLSDPGMEKDIMRIKSGPFIPQLQKIVDTLPTLKADRPHGPKAVQSAHDTSAMTTLSWMTVELSDVHAVGAFPYLIPILPEIFELRELNDNPDLQRSAGRLFAMTTSITPAFDLIEPLMSTLISVLQNSPSWRTKMHSMPVLSVIYFRNLSLLSESCKAKCLDVVAACLRDPNQEVREMASATLSGFLRCSQRSMVVVLKDRFTREINNTRLPKRKGTQPGQVNPEYQSKLVELHGAVLGATALVEAFPYTIPKFIPKLLADVLAPRVSEPAPISTTIRSCVASFKRTHEKYQDKFSEDELSQMNYAQAGNSYYA